MARRKQITVQVAPVIERALRARAKASGLPLSRVVEAVARRGLGLDDLPAPVPPVQPEPPTTKAA